MSLQSSMASKARQAFRFLLRRLSGYCRCVIDPIRYRIKGFHFGACFFGFGAFFFLRLVAEKLRMNVRTFFFFLSSDSNDCKLNFDKKPDGYNEIRLVVDD